ncbi:MAG: hypothetical protein IKC10_01070 [Alphaproteobacteria bacterium]|nr:hypothetical protein [Alphaproteobacteria bacterium]
MPTNKQTSCVFEVDNTKTDKFSSFVFDTKEEFITHLIKTKEIKKDPSRYNDGLIHLIGTLKIDNRVKKGLNWNDVVSTAAIVDKGMISRYQYLPRTVKGVKTFLDIPSLALYMFHNNFDAVYKNEHYSVDLFRIPAHASHLDFSSVSSKLTLFYGHRIALSRLPKAKSILGLSPKHLEVDCPDAYHVAKEKGCGTDILDVLRPQNPIFAYINRVIKKF